MEGNRNLIENEEMKEDGKIEIYAIKVGNLFASYEYIDRDISIDYFYNLNCNTKYEEIVNEIGRPNGGRGSGMVTPYYQVGDQYVEIWFSLNQEGEYDKILGMSLFSTEEYIEEIPLKYDKI